MVNALVGCIVITVRPPIDYLRPNRRGHVKENVNIVVGLVLTVVIR